MKRRSFLCQAGLAIAGGATASGTDATAAQSDALPPPTEDEARAVLVTSAGSNLCHFVAEQLSDSWQVRVTGPAGTKTPFPFKASNLSHEDSLSTLVAGVDAVVHLALPPPATRGTALIDFRTRQTYNLLREATRQGVRTVVYLSSLAIMMGYDKRLMITEDYQPQPTPEAEMLSHYLGEFTCREFARAGELDVVVLRLGGLAPSERTSPRVAGLPQTRVADAANAIASVLERAEDDKRSGLAPWSVIHIHSAAQSTRFPLTKARRLLDFRPLPMEATP
jgi:nucleoside-diphosphate-sugar epimerase